MQPCVVIAARDLEDGTRAGAEIAHFREFVQPVEHTTAGGPRQLSAFCTQLTGITQEEVNAASPLGAVLDRFDAWVGEKGFKAALEQGTAVFVAHGGWDLQDQLPLEAKRKGIPLPSYWGEHTDLKVVFSLACPEARGSSLQQMLDHLSLGPPQGRLHSGLDE
jgi:3'-5' exoribonuclease 1